MTIDDLMNDPERRLVVCRLVRQGYVKIQEKYGNIMEFIRNHPNITANKANDEISRRDYLLYRYVRMYSRQNEEDNQAPIRQVK